MQQDPSPNLVCADTPRTGNLRRRSQQHLPEGTGTQSTEVLLVENAPREHGQGYARVSGLDVLRAYAVGLVLLAHLPLPASWAAGEAGPARWAVARVLSLGGWGVDLFFVLSGFLVSGLLFKELEASGHVRPLRFILRRGFKIWPSYYAAYGVAVLVSSRLLLFKGDLVGVIKANAYQWANLFFIQNYVRPGSRWFASWSLAVEEHFYLVIPLLAWLGRKSVITACCCVAVVLAPVARYVLTAAGQGDLAYLQTHARMDALSAGVLVCLLRRGSARHFASLAAAHWVSAPILAIGASLFLATTPLAVPLTMALGYSLAMVAFLPLVARAVAAKADGSPLKRALARIGTYSYTIYLGQVLARSLPLQRAVGLFLSVGSEGAVIAESFLFVGITLAWGYILSHTVERPLLKLRDRWLPSDARGL